MVEFILCSFSLWCGFLEKSYVSVIVGLLLIRTIFL